MKFKPKEELINELRIELINGRVDSEQINTVHQVIKTLKNWKSDLCVIVQDEADKLFIRGDKANENITLTA